MDPELASPVRVLATTAVLAVVLSTLLLGQGCVPDGTSRPVAPDLLRPGLRAGEIYTGSHLRTWTVYVPPGIQRSHHLAPLVVVLHGSGGDGRGDLTRNGWLAEADRGGFIVAAPDGLPARPDEPADTRTNPRLWNDGHLVGAPEREAIDDVAFVVAMLDRLDADLPVDPTRTYLAGHSNGGGMAFRVAAGASERFAALAVVAGHVWTSERPSHPMPTLYIVGTKDPLVPLAGGPALSAFARMLRPPVAVTLRRWATALGIRDPVPRLVRDDVGERVELYGAPGTVTLEACYVKGQGHSWPGSALSSPPETTTGPRVATVDATRLIWRHFEQSSAR